MCTIVIDSSRALGIEKEEIENFLGRFQLSLDADVEYTAVALLHNKIVGTCSFSGRVLKCFGVGKELQGEGIAARLITHVTNVLFDKGIYETFIFTKESNRDIFEGLGYSCVYTAEGASLLEGGTADVRKYVQGMYDSSGLGSEEKAGLVMNCNPFTLGHRYLIEKASRENESVVIFVVEEDCSVFPFKTRMELIKKGTADLRNVRTIPGGNYIISSNTFPCYFIKKEDERLNTFTRLDAGIFSKYIAPAFNIKRRYVGTEPFDRVTEAYNKALLEVLPPSGIEVRLIERLRNSNRIVSASEVRKLIKMGNWSEVKAMVPDTTCEFLTSDKAQGIIEKIKGAC